MALDEAFDVNSLHELRKAVLAEAAAVGMSGDRASIVVLAVHELAANAVRHGGGAGRARMWVVAGELYCQVSDPGPASSDGDAGVGVGGTLPWAVRPGHGLWLVRNAADHFSIASTLAGSNVTAVFVLPR